MKKRQYSRIASMKWNSLTSKIGSRACTAAATVSMRRKACDVGAKEDERRALICSHDVGKHFVPIMFLASFFEYMKIKLLANELIVQAYHVDKHLSEKQETNKLYTYLLWNFGYCESANPQIVPALHKLRTVVDGEVDSF